MKRYTKIIDGIEVLFITIDDCNGFFFTHEDKEYGNYIKGDSADILPVLEDTVEIKIKELKK